MTNMYQVGDAVVLQATFSDINGTATDPTAVTLKVRDPGGSDSTYTLAGGEVTKSATGVFRYTLSITSSGRYLYKWYGTGTVQAASADTTLEARATSFN